MKGPRKRGESTVFRVNLQVYPKEVVEKVFGGKGTTVFDLEEENEKYMVFSSDLPEEDIYEMFNKMVELVVS